MQHSPHNQTGRSSISLHGGRPDDFDAIPAKVGIRGHPEPRQEGLRATWTPDLRALDSGPCRAEMRGEEGFSGTPRTPPGGPTAPWTPDRRPCVHMMRIQPATPNVGHTSCEKNPA